MKSNMPIIKFNDAYGDAFWTADSDVWKFINEKAAVSVDAIKRIHLLS